MGWLAVSVWCNWFWRLYSTRHFWRNNLWMSLTTWISVRKYLCYECNNESSTRNETRESEKPLCQDASKGKSLWDVAGRGLDMASFEEVADPWTGKGQPICPLVLSRYVTALPPRGNGGCLYLRNQIGWSRQGLVIFPLFFTPQVKSLRVFCLFHRIEILPVGE